MPSHQMSPVGLPSLVTSATLVKMEFDLEGRHRVWIGLVAGAGRDAEEAGLGVDGAQLAGGIGFDPGDVVADCPDLPAVETCGRDEHGEIGFAASAGEGGGDVGLFGFTLGVGWRFNADDQHVLGHPAFVACNVTRRCARRNIFCPAMRCRRSRSHRTRFRASQESARCTWCRSGATAHPAHQARAGNRPSGGKAPRA